MIYEFVLAFTITMGVNCTDKVPLDFYKTCLININYVTHEVGNPNRDGILRISKKYSVPVVYRKDNYRQMVVDMQKCDIIKFRNYVKELDVYVKNITPVRRLIW